MGYRRLYKFKGGKMTVKIMTGGSPCTFWSIAKGEGRETKASGDL